MASDRKGESSADTLNGWKEIAAFLGKSVRTAQRWESELGLPTHRIKTPDGQIVFGRRSEIESWRSSMDQRELGLVEASAEHEPNGTAPDAGVRRNGPVALRRVGWVALAFLAIAAATFGIGKFRARLPQAVPTTLRFAGRDLQAVDPSGRVVWSRHFDTDVSPVLEPDASFARADINGDGQLEDLVPIRYGRLKEPVSLKSDALLAFSSDGRLLWTATSNRRVSCGDEKYDGPWTISAMLVSHGRSPDRVWVSFVHNTWWPSFVVEILPDGTQVPRYFQAGWIMSLAEWQTPTGTWGVAGGVMNEPGRASVTLFDLNGAEQLMPATAPIYTCSVTGPNPRPQRVVLLPNFEVPQAYGNAYVIVGRIRVIGPDLVATTDGPTVATIAADGSVTDLAAGDAYWFVHRQLEGAHRLNHTIAACPDLIKPKEIRYWTAANGWRSAAITMKNHQSASQY